MNGIILVNGHWILTSHYIIDTLAIWHIYLHIEYFYIGMPLLILYYKILHYYYYLDTSLLFDNIEDRPSLGITLILLHYIITLDIIIDFDTGHTADTFHTFNTFDITSHNNNNT